MLQMKVFIHGNGREDTKIGQFKFSSTIKALRHEPMYDLHEEKSTNNISSRVNKAQKHKRDSLKSLGNSSQHCA